MSDVPDDMKTGQSFKKVKQQNKGRSKKKKKNRFKDKSKDHSVDIRQYLELEASSSGEEESVLDEEQEINHRQQKQYYEKLYERKGKQPMDMLLSRLENYNEEEINNIY